MGKAIQTNMKDSNVTGHPMSTLAGTSTKPTFSEQGGEEKETGHTSPTWARVSILLAQRGRAGLSTVAPALRIYFLPGDVAKQWKAAGFLAALSLTLARVLQ